MAETNSMKKAGTDEMQFLLFFGIQIKICKKLQFQDRKFVGFCRKMKKWLLFPNQRAIIKTIRWQKVGDEMEKASLSASELWK